MVDRVKSRSPSPLSSSVEVDRPKSPSKESFSDEDFFVVPSLSPDQQMDAAGTFQEIQQVLDGGKPLSMDALQLALQKVDLIQNAIGANQPKPGLLTRFFRSSAESPDLAAARLRAQISQRTDALRAEQDFEGAKAKLSDVLGDLEPTEKMKRGLAAWTSDPQTKAERQKAFTSFVADLDKLRAENQRRLKAGEAPISFTRGIEDLHLPYGDKFGFADIENDATREALRNLMTYAIDSAAPQSTLDTDTYLQLNQPDKPGKIARTAEAARQFSALIAASAKTNPAYAAWMENAKRFGNNWNHGRNEFSSLQRQPIVESAEWRRNENGSLTRRIATARVLDDDIQHHDINLNLNGILGRTASPQEEDEILAALNSLGNAEAEDRDAKFDRAPPAIEIDDQSKARLKSEMLRFLSDTDRAHAQEMLHFSKENARRPQDIADAASVFETLHKVTPEAMSPDVYALMNKTFGAQPLASAALTRVFNSAPEVATALGELLGVVGAMSQEQTLHPDHAKQLEGLFTRLSSLLEQGEKRHQVNSEDAEQVMKFAMRLQSELSFVNPPIAS